MLIAANPFISSYVQSDWFGKIIFWGLFTCSAIVWTLLLHKSWIFYKVKHLSQEFTALFSEKEPLALQCARPFQGTLLEIPHPFFEIYKVFKQCALQIINRNHSFAPQRETSFSDADLALLENQVLMAIKNQMRKLEKNLYILSTIVTLAPFVGLLGTVWGILLTFSQLHAKGVALSNASMLSGLSLALTTTVIGLLIAIPALIGNNFLKNRGRELLREMEDFAHLLLSSIELHYRRPDHAQKSPMFV